MLTKPSLSQRYKVSVVVLVSRKFIQTNLRSDLQMWLNWILLTRGMGRLNELC